MNHLDIILALAIGYLICDSLHWVRDHLDTDRAEGEGIYMSMARKVFEVLLCATSNYLVIYKVEYVTEDDMLVSFNSVLPIKCIYYRFGNPDTTTIVDDTIEYAKSKLAKGIRARIDVMSICKIS